MKCLSIVFLLSVTACTSSNDNAAVSNTDSLKTVNVPSPADVVLQHHRQDSIRNVLADTAMKYSNERFREVTVTKTGPNTYRIKGKGRIFEASFGWLIEEDHNELLNGHAMTDAGAPAWGNFNFIVTVKKEKQNAVLHILLFEASPKDGSRQYTLALPLTY
jgi:hypothetical protein